MLFIGDDWAEAHHDIEIEDDAGRVLARRRLPEGLAGITTLHELVAEHLDPTAEPDQVQLGIETDRGPWVQALLAAGYGVFAINLLQVARYRERHSSPAHPRQPARRHPPRLPANPHPHDEHLAWHNEPDKLSPAA